MHPSHLRLPPPPCISHVEPQDTHTSATPVKRNQGTRTQLLFWATWSSLQLSLIVPLSSQTSALSLSPSLSTSLYLLLAPLSPNNNHYLKLLILLLTAVLAHPLTRVEHSPVIALRPIDDAVPAHLSKRQHEPSLVTKAASERTVFAKPTHCLSFQDTEPSELGIRLWYRPSFTCAA